MTFEQSLAEFSASLLPHADALADVCAALLINPTDSQALDQGFRTAQNLTGTIDFALAIRGTTTPPAMALLAHEVRNPLCAIVGMFHLLRKKPSLTFAKTALDSVLHMRRVIEDDLAAEVVSLSSLCQLVVDSYVGLSTQKGIVLRLDVPDDLPFCQMHSVQLRQIMLNLLGNTMKFTPAGGVVSLKATRSGSTGLIIVVQDTGVGMSEELRVRLFQPYVQAPETASQGCGLGLSITHGLVQELGGRIEVSSQLGVGTEFRVELPLSAVLSPVPTHFVNESLLSSSSAPAVLLVDDDEMIREVFGWNMEDLGILCVGVGTCAEARDRAGERHFDLILVDGLYGAAQALVPELRAIAERKGYRPGIIGFSGRDSLGVELDGVLPKPASAMQVLPLLQRFGVDTSRLAAA
jgi:two-component sensor histidine kinase